MKRETVGTDGSIGLGVLGLMVIALVAGEIHSNLQTLGVLAAGHARAPDVLIELGPQIRWPADAKVEGAIREVSVPPLSIDRLDLGWLPDDVVIEEYRRSDF